MKNIKKLGAILLSTLFLMSSCSSNSNHGLSADQPVTLRLWHYYSGSQKEAFDDLVEEFNTTVGKEKGIIVDAIGKGSISNIANDVNKLLKNKEETEKLPNMFAAYQDTAQMAMNEHKLVSMETYLSEKEIHTYVDGFLKDGRYVGSDETMLFPIAKASEVMIINKEEWDRFASATHVSKADLSTWEGLAKTAELYYEYSNGKAFFARDALANYLICGAHQLQDDIFQEKDWKVAFAISDKTLRRLWDNYYIPFIKGYYVKNGRFASDDIKTKDVIATVSSTAGGTFYPNEVIDEHGDKQKVSYLVLPTPHFENAQNAVISQGGGIAITKADETSEYACIVFLQWFTETKRNITFSAASSYLPVKKEANTYQTWETTLKKHNMNPNNLLKDIVKTTMDEVNDQKLYAANSFDGSYEARSYLEKAANMKAIEDQKAIQKAIQAGKSQEEAMAYYLSDENFAKWVQQCRKDMEALLQGDKAQ